MVIYNFFLFFSFLANFQTLFGFRKIREIRFFIIFAFVLSDYEEFWVFTVWLMEMDMRILLNFGLFLVFSKTALKLAASRIKLLKNKKDAQVKQLKRDVAQLLESGQERTAMIRVCYSRSLLFLLVFFSFHLGFDHFLIILLCLLWFYSSFGSFDWVQIGMVTVAINSMESIIKLFSLCAYSSSVFKTHWMHV